jgi:hypothetical protein
MKKSLVLMLACYVATTSTVNAASNHYIPHLTDCASLFGLLSQSPSKHSEGFKAMAASFSSYAVQVVPQTELELELDNSKRRIGALVSESKLKDDQSAVSKQAEICFSVLKNAEMELWPKLPELSRSLTPRFLVTE